MNLLLSVILFCSEGVASSLVCPTAREWGLGGAGLSFARGPDAVYFNPASLVSPDKNLGFSVSYSRIFLDIEQSALSLTKKISIFNIGVGLINFDYGDLDFKPDYPTESDSATFNANDLTILVAAATKLSPKGTIGLGFKYLRENIFIYTASARAFNLTLNYLPNQNNTLSFGAFDIGNALVLKDEPYGLPVRFGLGYNNQIKKFLTGIDCYYLIRSGDWLLSVGEEITLSQILQLRCGVRYFDGLTISGGLGLNLSWLALEYGFGYLPKNLGFSHYFGLKKIL